MSGLRDAVRRARRELAAAGVASPDHDARVLAAHALGVGVAELHRLLILDRQEEPSAYAALIAERARRTPLQHLTGRAGFRQLELAVGPGVFIPRPETESVVDRALVAVDRCPEDFPVVIDLCTGSGAIAFAIKSERPATIVYAAEISELALAWARRNRDVLGLDVELVCADARTAYPELDGTAAIVVSNPPYIPIGAVPKDPEVRDHDPTIALYGGSADGLAVPLAVAARARELLRPDGVLVMEHADSQGNSLPTALRESGGWVRVTDHCDFNDRPRCTVAVRAS